MHTVIFTGGRLEDGGPVRRALASADKIIAADSGAMAAQGMGITPSAVIGDFDSLNADHRSALKDKGVKLVVYPEDKDKTDTELAMDFAVKDGAESITVLGGIDGGRIDHILANIFVMNGHDASIRFIDGTTTVWRAHGPCSQSISGTRGDRLSLIPLTPTVDNIDTDGLKYSLKKGTLRADQARGVSNVMTRKRASVTWSRGTLLFVHDEHPI